MVAARTVQIEETEREALERARDRHRLASVRERATAVLLVAEGRSGRDVALHGFGRPKKEETIYQWLDWYAAGGLAALEAHQHGGARRGRLRPGHRRAHSRDPAPAPAGHRWDGPDPLAVG